MYCNRQNEYSIAVEEFLYGNLYNWFQLNSEYSTMRTSNSKSNCGISGMPQVRVGIVGRAMRLVGNHMQFYM